MKPNTFMTGTANEYDDFFYGFIQFHFSMPKNQFNQNKHFVVINFFVQKYTKI